jgi:hypothetical protein
LWGHRFRATSRVAGRPMTSGRGCSRRGLINMVCAFWFQALVQPALKATERIGDQVGRKAAPRIGGRLFPGRGDSRPPGPSREPSTHQIFTPPGVSSSPCLYQVGLGHWIDPCTERQLEFSSMHDACGVSARRPTTPRPGEMRHCAGLPPGPGLGVVRSRRQWTGGR